MTELYVPLSFEKRLLRYQTPSFSLTIDTIFCHIVPLTPGGHDKRCPLFFGVSDDPIPWTKKKGMVYHSYPMILPFLISLSCSKMIPYSEVFITWFHGKILRFYGKIPTFPCSTGKKTRFHFSIDFSHFFFVMFGMIFPNSEDDGLETRVPTTRPSPRQARTECLGQRSVSWRSSQRWQYP